VSVLEKTDHTKTDPKEIFFDPNFSMILKEFSPQATSWTLFIFFSITPLRRSIQGNQELKNIHLCDPGSNVKLM
jgi:hypothetical protein